MIILEIPEEEKRPIDYAEDEVDFELVIESGLEEVAVIDEVDNRLCDEEDDSEDESKVVQTSEL